jgi:hypothetical protein
MCCPIHQALKRIGRDGARVKLIDVAGLELFSIPKVRPGYQEITNDWYEFGNIKPVVKDADTLSKDEFAAKHLGAQITISPVEVTDDVFRALHLRGLIHWNLKH